MVDKKIKAARMADDILDFVNSFGCDEEAFATRICRGHRTLQQSVMRLFLTTIRHMAENPADERNEAAVELAQKIMEASDDVALPLI